jgi:hypothetical protein
MGKLDIMHGVCGDQDIFAEKTIFDVGLFCKTFYHFKVHPLPNEQKVFQYITKSPELNHTGISLVSHRLSFKKKTATGLSVHHSSRLNRWTF